MKKGGRSKKEKKRMKKNTRNKKARRRRRRKNMEKLYGEERNRTREEGERGGLLKQYIGERRGGQ